MHSGKWFAGAAVAALLGVASAGLAQAAEIDNVTLQERNGMFAIDVAQKELKAGKVTFDVTNKGADMQHEMIVVQLTPQQAADPTTLPYNEDSATVDEEKINDRGEVSELDPGKEGSLTLDLQPGDYMLLCNVPGHYKAGMYTIIHVS